MVASADTPSKGLPTAQEAMEKLALAEAEKASEAARRHAAAEAEKKALLDKLTAASGVSEEERTKRAAAIIERAVASGLTEVLVMRLRLPIAYVKEQELVASMGVGYGQQHAQDEVGRHAHTGRRVDCALRS